MTTDHRPFFIGGDKLRKVMIKTLSIVTFLFVLVCGAAVLAQVKTFTPVTQQMLENPSPDDWLMFSRTFDAQRFSPLKQINKQNVKGLALAWQRGMGAGQTE